MNTINENIVLPPYEENVYANCYACGRPMVSVTITELYKYRGRNFLISNIQAHKCHWCETYIYTSKTAELIEDALENAMGEEE